MLDSLTTITVEPRWCPLHQSILLTQHPIHEILTKKYWELAELENDLFFRRPFWIFLFKKKKKKLLQFNEKTKGFHMRYHLFLHYGWFLQNLGKDFIRTNMHTTVNILAGISKQVFKIPMTARAKQKSIAYSCVHISSDEVFSKILKKPSIVQK